MGITLKTNLQGFKRNWWRKNLHGFFTNNGKLLTDAQVRRMVNWGIEHGCRTEADIPEDKVVEILREPNYNDTQTKLF
jgi:hypothetical protein